MACDNTALDPGLNLNGVADTSISIAHGASPQWWLSPAITLNGVSAGASAHASPSPNLTDVTFHRADGALSQGSTGVLVAVYVCVPGLAMNPSDASKVKQLGSTVFVDQSHVPAGADTSLSGLGKAITWTAATSAALPDGPGHKCLVAVAYPDGLAADPVCFHQAGGPGAADPHYAQLNVAIEPVPMHSERPWRFRTFTINPDRAAPARATLRAYVDLEPSKAVIDVLMPALKAMRDFRQVARHPPKGFALQLSDYPDAKKRDRTQSGGGGLWRFLRFLRLRSHIHPDYEADVQLKPGHIANIEFIADVSTSTSGDAHIFHLTHARSDGHVIGGLTVVTVVQ
jgi:hypothetical protein